jgi:hypothetical protein
LAQASQAAAGTSAIEARTRMRSSLLMEELFFGA